MAHRRQAAWLLLCMLACSGAARRSAAGCVQAEPHKPAGAIECRFAANTQPPVERNVLLHPGERKRVVLEPLYLDAEYGWQLKVAVKAGAVELLNTTYQPRENALPENQFENDQGFSGLITLSHPSGGGKYVVACRSLRTLADTEHTQKRSEDEETSSRREAGLKKALGERERCRLNNQFLTRDGPRCPPKRPLVVRRDALIDLHKLGARRFLGVDLDEVALPSADLRDSWFDYAQIRRANLREAQLYFAHFARANLEETDLTRANLWSAFLREASLRRAKLNAAKLQHSDLQQVDLEGADLSNAYLMYATASEAQLDGANLAGAMLMGARFTNAKLTNVDFVGANLTDAILDGADLRGARNLSQQQLDLACGDPETLLPEGLQIHRGPRQCVPGMDYVPCSMRRDPGVR